MISEQGPIRSERGAPRPLSAAPLDRRRGESQEDETASQALERDQRAAAAARREDEAVAAVAVGAARDRAAAIEASARELATAHTAASAECAATAAELDLADKRAERLLVKVYIYSVLLEMTQHIRICISE